MIFTGFENLTLPWYIAVEKRAQFSNQVKNVFLTLSAIFWQLLKTTDWKPLLNSITLWLSTEEGCRCTSTIFYLHLSENRDSWGKHGSIRAEKRLSKYHFVRILQEISVISIVSTESIINLGDKKWKRKARSNGSIKWWKSRTWLLLDKVNYLCKK